MAAKTMKDKIDSIQHTFIETTTTTTKHSRQHCRFNVKIQVSKHIQLTGETIVSLCGWIYP